jgi:hypothetical protein
MKYYSVTTKQILLMSAVMAIIISALVTINNSLRDYLLLPQVVQKDDGACVKVINFENGHAFNCNDVNVILRRYRKVNEE